MIKIEDISYDHVRLTMVGRIERPKSVTIDERTGFWSKAESAVQVDLSARVRELEEENDRLSARYDD